VEYDFHQRYHIREAGSTAIQEVAFTFANAIAYIEAALAAGLEIDSFAPRLSFFFNAHSNFLEEIAKFRGGPATLREVDAQPFRGQKSERSWMLRFHAQTAGSTLTAQQPDVKRDPDIARGDGGRIGRSAIAAYQFSR